MAALHEMNPTIQFEIFTTVPSWFFEASLSGPFTYHSLLTDIGLIQKTPLHVDLTKTREYLDKFLPFEQSQTAQLAGVMGRLNCRVVICDIAPMGILVAREAGIPSVLVENFTWDWLYREYVGYDSRLKSHADYLETVFDEADFHVKTEPICSHGLADLTSLPVSRSAKVPAEQIRQRLGIPKDVKMVMITMGGVPEQSRSMSGWTHQRDVYFVFPGGSNAFQISGNLILLPHHADFFHPDLIMASDAVVGKVGYSTLAETYHAGLPFGYIMRPHFRESEILSSYIKKRMSGLAIEEDEFQDGGWVIHLPELLALRRIKRKGPNGAEQVARFLFTLFNREGKTSPNRV